MASTAKKFIKTDCAQCKNKAPVVRRIGTGAGVIFKGSGFYQTDYRSENYKSGAKAEKESSEKKSDGDTKKGDTPAKKKDSTSQDSGGSKSE
jgi:predicted nucleic acid-binding Zn ribbon protein